jgi:hypothetical protein
MPFDPSYQPPFLAALTRTEREAVVRPQTPTSAIENMLDDFADAARADPTLSIAPLLPLLFTLRGKPYALDEHWMFAPLFRVYMRAKMTVILAARQTGKTQNISAADVATAALNPFTNILLVTPLYEQIRRWSSNYIKPIMDGCTIPGFTQTVGRAKDNDNVLQRGFPNGSNLLFSFAFLDCERVRGVSAGMLGIDEVQGINPMFIDIIKEVLSGSKLGLERYTGTPKTKINTAAILFDKTSQGAWAVKCDGCNYENIFDEETMLKNIGKTGPICRKPGCGKKLHPQTGYYVHKYPEKQWLACGYRIPQVVHPLHYAVPHKWRELVRKMENMRPSQFANECLALASDVGASLISDEDIRACGKLPHRTLNEIKMRKEHYKLLIAATDWGGRGRRKNARKVSDESELEFSSYTANAVLGVTHAGEFECLYVDRLPHDTDPTKEVEQALRVFFEAGCDIWAYDATGAGEIRVTMALQNIHDRNLDAHNVMPIEYTALSVKKPILLFTGPGKGGVLYTYQLDKTRGCFLAAFMLLKHRLGLPDYDQNKQLLRDFLAWHEDTQESYRGKKITTVVRDPNLPDDVAQAIVMGLCGLCHAAGAWPDLAKYVDSMVALDSEDVADVSPEVSSWEETSN